MATGEQRMTRKQQIGTCVLAALIIASVALMPVNAEQKGARASSPRTSGMVATSSAPPPAKQREPNEAADLTYN
jgi:hypothetical protein